MSADSFQIVAVAQASDPRIADVRRLFTEYAEELAVDLCFQGFTEELESLPGKYAPPAGRLLVALRRGEAVACAAFRPLEPGVCELKRFFVHPQHRQSGIASALLDTLLESARKHKYHLARLDTLSRLVPALKFYEKHGFVACDAYYPNPEPDVLYFERNLIPDAEPELHRFLDYAGRLTHWPAAKGNSEVRPMLVRYLAQKFSPDESLTEREVNGRLQQWHRFNDHAFLRRELVDSGWLVRDAYGRAYSRATPGEVQ